MGMFGLGFFLGVGVGLAFCRFYVYKKPFNIKW